MMEIQSEGEYASIESSDKKSSTPACALESIPKYAQGGGKHKQCTSY
jgi:hypothetical protein